MGRQETARRAPTVLSAAEQRPHAGSYAATVQVGETVRLFTDRPVRRWKKKKKTPHSPQSTIFGGWRSHRPTGQAQHTAGVTNSVLYRPRSPCSALHSTMSEESSHDSSSKLDGLVGTGARPLQIGDEIPNFTCESHMGSITLHSYINSGWGVIFT